MTPEAAAEKSLARAGAFGERAVGVARLALTSLVLVRLVVIGGLGRALAGGGDAAIELLVLVATAAMSVLLLRGKPRPLASVALDAVACHLALLGNVLGPDDEYEGLLRMPDTAAILLILAASGARLSVRVATTSTLLNAASLIVLLVFDRALRGDELLYGAKDVAIFGIYFAVAALFAFGSARGGRAIASEAARAAQIATRARTGLRELLRDHHDVRSSLTSARMRLEQLKAAHPDDARLAELEADLEEVTRMIGATRDRAYKEIAELDEPQDVNIDEVARSVVGVLAKRFPDVTFSVESEPARALVVGGAQGLARILLNLLVNAREGDGSRGAKKARVSVRRADGGKVAISILDDGPGFPDSVLRAPPGAFVSTKEEGSGFGMFLVASLVDASGGGLVRENRDGGAFVAITLPTR